MPLVFVHGVATRQTPEYQVAVAQRDALFKRLVTSSDDPVFDPDWGSNAVTFAHGGWVPDKGAAEPFSFGSSNLPGGISAAGVLASRSPEQGIDLALAALLAKRAKDGTQLSADDVAVFEAAVRYLEGSPDAGAFGGGQTEPQFIQTLRDEIGTGLPVTPHEPMGVSDVFSAIGSALKWATDPLRNAGSDALLKLIRVPLSKQVALFLGDIFVYLRWRETDRREGTYNRIFKPIIADLARANSLRTQGRKLVLVGHSLGSVILYDLLTDPSALADVEAQSGRALTVDAWVSVGAQPGLFADMGLYDRQVGADGRLPKPGCVGTWMNVYDFTDVLSFRAQPFFADVTDYEFDNVSGALEAHSAYFQRPSFYKRLRARLTAS